MLMSYGFQHSQTVCPIYVAGLLQHVPRINGEIPSVNEATLDHQRLLDRCCLRLL